MQDELWRTYLRLPEELGVARQTQRVKELRNYEILEPHVDISAVILPYSC